MGGFWEVLFAMKRGHEINEGFFVTPILFTLTLPLDLPLWQAAMGITFGIVVAKEVFGGTGKNFLNPALTGRASLFCLPCTAFWRHSVDGRRLLRCDSPQRCCERRYGGSTSAYTWSEAFLGAMPGSIGETSRSRS